MRIKETKVYQFDELSDKAKERARQWWREGPLSCELDHVIEDAERLAGMMGILFKQRPVPLMHGKTRYEPAVYWSGFSNQGDGACFEETWDASRVQPGKVAAEVGDSDSCKEIKRIAVEFERLAKVRPGASFNCSKFSHRYSHPHTVNVDCTPGDADDVPETILAKYRTPEDDAENADELAKDRWRDDFPEAELIEAARDFMQWIYRQLESEYEYQNADAQVDETILANKYEFTEDGERA